MSDTVHSDAYVIEVDSATAGLVVRAHDRAGFRFFASAPAFARLDGLTFRSPQDAERAARRHASTRSSRQRPSPPRAA
jgi:hypothetical protein